MSFVTGCRSGEAEAAAEAAGGLAGDRDEVAAVHAGGVAAGVDGVEAGELLEVDEGAAVDAFEDAGGEAVLEVLQREVGEQGAAGGVQGDELAVEDGVGQVARVEQADALAGGDREAHELGGGRASVDAEAVTGAGEGLAEAHGVDRL